MVRLVAYSTSYSPFHKGLDLNSYASLFQRQDTQYDYTQHKQRPA